MSWVHTISYASIINSNSLVQKIIIIIERIGNFTTQLSLQPNISICWSSCICTKPTNELVEKCTKTQEVKHGLSGHAPPPIKRLLYLHMQSVWGCGSRKNSYCLQMLQNYEVMFSCLGCSWTSDEKMLAFPVGQSELFNKGKIALLSKNGQKSLCDDYVHTTANVVNSFFCRFIFAFDCML